MGFSKLRGVRERERERESKRAPGVAAQVEADVDEGARRPRVAAWARGRGGGGAGAAALSGFTLQWSRTIPPSVTVSRSPPPPPSPLLRHVRAHRRDSRPRRTSASAKHFFIRSILRCRLVALPIRCTMHVHPRVHKVRRLDSAGLDRLDYLGTRRPKGRRATASAVV